jgi:hypothetical protein
MDNDISPRDDGAFAAAVIRFYNHAVKEGEAAEFRPYGGNQSREVRQVACGLAFIRQLLDEYTMRPHVLADIPQSGVAEAYGILAHLTTGGDHPAARHIKGLRSRFRPQRAAANSIERTRQAVIVGLVRALQAVAAIPQSEAIRKTIAAVKSVDVSFTETQIRNWDNRFQQRGNSLPDGFANVLVREAAPDTDKILALGATHVSALWDVPRIC